MPTLRSTSYHHNDDDEDNEEEEEEEEANKLSCLSCAGDYGPSKAGTCKECYEEANETEEELKREIEELKAKVAFLRFWSPADRHNRFNGPAFSDVVLIASDDCSGGSTVPVSAHKTILVSRSPVFKAMLENEMEESLSGTIKISDVSYDALRAFVNYLYTAEACLDEQLAYDLLVLAEKYQVKQLKGYCERYLVSKLNWNNALTCYAFAHQHNASHIQDAALSIVTDNMDKLTKQDDYALLVEKDPRLVVEIYEAYLSKQVNTAARKDCPGKP